MRRTVCRKRSIMVTRRLEISNPSMDVGERRAAPRRAVTGRSAIWFNEGPEGGIFGTVSDLSLAGFSVRLQSLRPDIFVPGALLYCVLLIQDVHVDSLAKVVSIRPAADGVTHIGFRIESQSEVNQQLLSGVIHYLAVKGSLDECENCPQASGKDCRPQRCMQLAGIY